MSEYTTVRIQKSQKPRFEQARDLLARDLGEKPSQDQVVHELVEAYLGGDPVALRSVSDD